ncbi:MAG: DUF3078 domain-containing protein [Tannerellaceae bacterium]|jgi:hypothetical protein|nr:DUF3078 domain-containing protein [Tannerellaceae bacterium]
MRSSAISILIISLGLVLTGGINTIRAQEEKTLAVPVIPNIRPEQHQDTDTVIPVRLEESDLGSMGNIRAQFEKQNSTYSVPVERGAGILRFINKDEIKLPPEALALIHAVVDSSLIFDENVTFKDTIIISPIFLPLVFRGNDSLEWPLYDPDFYKTKGILEQYIPKTEILPKYAADKRANDRLYRYMVENHPTSFKYSAKDLPTDIIAPVPLHVDLKERYEAAPIVVKSEVKADNVEAAPIRFIPDRLYWQSAFESAIQFAQNYVSPNWHKGGTSNLNLYTRHALKYDYKKDKVLLTNEMELKLNAHNAPNDTLRNYRIGDDLLRFHSNFGYRAFNNKWYYTFDGEFKTQLFKKYQENTTLVQASTLAPLSVNIGVGMKYDLNKQFADKYKKFTLALNFAPLSYTYMYSIKDDIDLGRHGFRKNPETDTYETSLSKIGSTVRMDISTQFNRNVTLKSRFYYSTSYDRVEAELENTLTMAISRFFSTTINLYLRYDDGVTKNEDFDSYIQVNELISFGFNYKW